MKKKIQKSLWVVIIIGMTISISINYVLQIRMAQKNMTEESQELFGQIEKILEENTVEAENTSEEFRQTCLLRAKAAAYIVENKASILQSQDELDKIVELLQVDELHIFNTEGEIYAGSLPKYFGYSFDSGEQMAFFKPMLEDPSLELCQPITPNTAEGKLMQYAAVWREDGKGIVQIGMEPDRVLAVTAKNELSYIFSLLTENDGAVLYAADPETFEILGATDEAMIGRNLQELGLKEEQLQIKSGMKKFHEKMQDEWNYCMFTMQDNVLIGRICSVDMVYSNVNENTLFLTLCFLVLAGVMVLFITKYLDRNIVKSIDYVNAKLEIITDGGLDEKVEVRTTEEFAELSEHINQMVKSILSTTEKMSSILGMAQTPVGVYEYSPGMKRVQATDKVAELLHISEEEKEALLSNHVLFEEKIKSIKEFPVEGETDIFCVAAGEEKYIRMHTLILDNSEYGVLIDMSGEIREKRRILQERNQDSLTGLFSLRGYHEHIDRLYQNPDELRCGALIIFDMDNLKNINDTYGHEAGDRYLMGMSQVIASCSAPCQIAGRLGGDEFSLFIYGCENKEQLNEYVSELREKQRDFTVEIKDSVIQPVQFSMGAAFYPEESAQYRILENLADNRMYEDKRMRKALSRPSFFDQ